ncbi:MAG: hypothetical protein HWE08_12015 [Alphaproteobacteria bacterium]|nr:hypothetical protein [Alphaproteobacteria bacterium]
MIRDKLEKEEASLEAEAMRPRAGFLWAAGVVSILAVLAYFFEDMMVEPDGNGALAYAVLLGLLIMLAMFLVLCYRMPRIGNRLLGYDVAIMPTREKEKASFQYTGGFKVDTGLDEKRMSSKRKQARHSRKKLAETTRQMQAEKTTTDKKSDA